MSETRIHEVFLAEQETFVTFGKEVCEALDNYDTIALMAIQIPFSKWLNAEMAQIKRLALESCKDKLTAKKYRDKLQQNVQLVEKALYGAKCALRY